MGRAGRAGLGAALLVVGLAVVVYVPGLPGEFVYDDHRLIEKNEGLRRPFEPARAFLRDYYASDADRMGLGYYRPLAILSNEMDFRRGGGRPVAFHATSILLHAACSLLVLALGLRLFDGSLLAATAAGVLFAIHPAHAESVAFISGRVDPLATLFVMLAALAHLRANRSQRAWPWRAAAGVSWFSALLSKEMAITGPALIFVLEAAEEGLPRARELIRRAARYLPYALAFVPYLLLRKAALGALLMAPTGEGPVSVVRLFVVGGSYLAWLGVPPPGLHLEPPPAAGVAAVLAAVLVALVVSSIVLLWWKGARRSAALLAFCVLALLPVAQFRPIETELSERFLYLPSVGACLWIVLPLVRARTALARRAATALVLVLGVYDVGVLVPRVGLWRDEVRLWRAKLEEEPRSMRGLISLGGALARRGDIEGARAAYDRARSIVPVLDAQILAEMESLIGAGDDAVAAIRRSLDASPEDGALWNNLGFVLLQRKQAAEARVAFERSIVLVPVRSTAWLGLAWSCLVLEDYEAAERAATRASTLNPDLALARVIRAECVLHRGRACEALALVRDARLQDPGEEGMRRSVLERAGRECTEPR